MHEEMNSLNKNKTYDLVELPKGKKVLKNKWVFKLKKDGDKLVKYKARLVIKGFSQKQGINFDEIFSPVVKMSSIRVVLRRSAASPAGPCAARPRPRRRCRNYLSAR